MRERRTMKEQNKMGLLERKKYERSERRRKQRIKNGITVGVLAVLLIVVCVQWKPWEKLKFPSSDSTPVNNEIKGDKNQKEALRLETIEKAERMAASYGYDEAVEILQSIDGY